MKLRFYNAKILPAPDAEIVEGEVRTDGDTIVGRRRRRPVLYSRAGDRLRGRSFDERLLQRAYARGDVPVRARGGRSSPRGVAVRAHLPPGKEPDARRRLLGDDAADRRICAGRDHLFCGYVFFADAVYAAADRAHLCLALCCGENSAAAFDVLRFIEKNYSKYSTMSDRVRYYPGLHAEYTCSEKLIAEVAGFCGRSGRQDVYPSVRNAARGRRVHGAARRVDAAAIPA